MTAPNQLQAQLHDPGHDFKDIGLIHGARCHAEIARRWLPEA